MLGYTFCIWTKEGIYAINFDFDLQAKNSKGSKRWYLDNDENPNVVLEQSPNKDALCPEEVNHWLSYCNTYRQIRLVSENS